MNKIIPSIIILLCLGVVFKDQINIQPAPVDNTVVVNTVDEEMKKVVSEIVSVVKESKANQQKKNQASALWKGAGDMWAVVSIDTTSDKIALFNEELFSIYTKKYDLSNSFTGFAEAANKSFTSVLGEYPKQMTKEDCKKMSDLCYAIAWAFEQ